MKAANFICVPIFVAKCCIVFENAVGFKRTPAYVVQCIKRVHNVLAHIKTICLFSTPALSTKLLFTRTPNR